MILTIALAIPGTASSELKEPLDGETEAGAGPIHSDCLDHRQPRMCTRIVEELTEELGRFNEAFSPPDIDRLAAFYHEDAILYGGNPPRFFRGREEIRSGLLMPLAAGINSATIDLSAFRFQVISPNLIVVYGSPATVVTLLNGVTVTLPPLTQTHTWIRQGGDRDRPFVLLTDHNGGAESLDGGEASAGPIHPDCLDHYQPRMCTRVVEELTEELGRFNEAFSPPDIDRLAAFYHEDAILFVGSTGRFFRGQDEIRDEFFAPLAAGVENAVVDLSAFRFQVISAHLIILYGSPTTTVTFKDGTVVTLPPLPQTLTWVRQGGDPSRPFVALADHE
jgi:ketosteroid isomerase-like protein